LEECTKLSPSSVREKSVGYGRNVINDGVLVDRKLSKTQRIKFFLQKNHMGIENHFKLKARRSPGLPLIATLKETVDSASVVQLETFIYLYNFLLNRGNEIQPFTFEHPNLSDDS
jgi:hypothetical protein